MLFEVINIFSHRKLKNLDKRSKIESSRMKERRVKPIELFPILCPSICIVVRERWAQLTEDKRQEQSEEEIIRKILFVYLFEYIPSIIHYVKALALFMIEIIIIVSIILFIFERESLLGSFCKGERRKLEKS